MAPSHQHAGFAPTLESFLHSKLHLDMTVETAVTLLKRRQIRDPEPCALATAHVLSQVVAKSKWSDADQLLDRVYQVGLKLVDAQPQELVIGNIIRRVLGLIRDEAEEDRNENSTDINGGGSVPDLRIAATTAASALSSTSVGSPPRLVRQPSLLPTSNSYQSMFNLLSAVEPTAGSTDMSSTVSGASTPVQLTAGQSHGGPSAFSGRLSALRDEIIDGIEEIKDEIGQVDDQIASFAEGQIRPGDYVMVYSPSRTVEKFLIKAAVRRRYTLLLVEGSGGGSGGSGGSGAQGAGGPEAAGGRYAHLLKRLSAAKVGVIRVANTAVAAYMPRVNRVVVDARAITGNGGVIVSGGEVQMARAAHKQGCIVVTVGGVYKLSPEPCTNPEVLVERGDPGRLVPYSDGAMTDGIHIQSFATEYVPPNVVDVYVTNLGPHSKAYLENVIADHYTNEELELYGQ